MNTSASDNDGRDQSAMTPDDGELRTWTAPLWRLLGLLGTMDDAQPPSDLVSRTLRHIAENGSDGRWSEVHSRGLGLPPAKMSAAINASTSSSV